MTDLTPHKYAFRITSGDYHVDLEFSREELQRWAPDHQKHDVHYAAWILMNQLEADRLKADTPS